MTILNATFLHWFLLNEFKAKWLTGVSFRFVCLCVGDLFLRMLKCLILPLIVSSMISAVGSLDLSVSGRIGTRAIVYYMTTTVSAVILGIILVLTIHPGEGSDKGIVRASKGVRHVTTADMLMDLIRSKQFFYFQFQLTQSNLLYLYQWMCFFLFFQTK